MQGDVLAIHRGDGNRDDILRYSKKMDVEDDCGSEAFRDGDEDEWRASIRDEVGHEQKTLDMIRKVRSFKIDEVNTSCDERVSMRREEVGTPRRRNETGGEGQVMVERDGQRSLETSASSKDGENDERSVLERSCSPRADASEDKRDSLKASSEEEGGHEPLERVNRDVLERDEQLLTLMSRLPPPCLSVNLPIMEKPLSSELTPTRLGFPTEFPYEFDSPAFSPGFTSPGDSTETEDESSDDEEDFLAGLTRRLAPSTQRLPPPSINIKAQEKRQVAATSPQSTLSGLGSFSNSGSRSPILPPPQTHTTSFRRDNAWDVISAAAGEVARLKLGSYESHLPRHNPNPNPILRRQNAAFQTDRFLQQQRLLDQMWLCSQSRISSSENHIPKRAVNEEVTFDNLRYMRHNALSNASWTPQHAVTPLKRPSAGTGVFLPRRYPATSSDSLRKPVTVNTTAMLQSKVNPPQNLNFDEFPNLGSRRSKLDYECMLARSSLLARHGNFRAVGGNGCLNQERRLPHDWMY